ncbi:protein-tyrosine sulfotransferase-like isoform X2 [Silene latifolia]|uniref:protein-tyrosine sulfotransferase-like isoform X2 n=1 Tax=Silene latifolia TaxID=37657 RepID=UPI003D7842CC
MAESHDVRACIRKHPTLGDSVLDVAKRRLDHMLYVGVTEDHKESATAFAHVVGAQVISQLVGSNSSMGHLATNLTDTNNADTNNADTSKSKMTVKKLMESYEVCINQKFEALNYALSRISPVNFTKEARLQVPESVINQIISLNRLDMELYKYARDIFSQQHTNIVQKLKLESEEIISMNSFASPPWKDILLVMPIVLVVLALCVCLHARRTLKVKYSRRSI